MRGGTQAHKTAGQSSRVCSHPTNHESETDLLFHRGRPKPPEESNKLMSTTADHQLVAIKQVRLVGIILLPTAGKIFVAKPVATNFRVISFHLFSPFLVVPIIVFLVRN